MTTPLQARPIPDIVTDLPGPKARVHIEFDHAWTSPSLPRAYPIVPVRGLGCAVEDIDGNVFLDFAAGIAVNSTGHSHPAIVAAIQAQAAELQHFSASDFYLPIYAQAAAELARIAPMPGRNRTFIGNSGAEVVEAGLKLARYHTGRQNVIAFLGAFHGRTMGAVSLTASKAKYHAHFGPLLPGVYHVPFGNQGLEEIESRVFKRLMPADEFAAVIVEPIQGEGGYVVPEDDFLPRLRELCDRHGILLIADEVQSGAGRTGKMWAIEHWGVEPDILLTAKGIGSGMPVGAMVARAEVMSWGPGAHGSTYGGNPVALAALLETIRLLEGGLIANAAVRGDQIQDGLRPLVDRFPGIVKDVRGKGLMIGIQFDSGDTAEAVQMQAFDRGLLVLEAGEDCVRMSPPLVVTEAEAATAIRIFTESVAHVAAAQGRGRGRDAGRDRAGLRGRCHGRGLTGQASEDGRRLPMPGKVASMRDAIADLVRDGDTVAIEGFTHLIGFSAGHEIIRQRKRDLTLARMTPDLIYDQMIAGGVARKLIFSWLGNPGVGGPQRDPPPDRAGLARRRQAPRDRGVQPLRHGRPVHGRRREPAVHAPALLLRDGPAEGEPADPRDPLALLGRGRLRRPAAQPGRLDHPRPARGRERQHPDLGPPRAARRRPPSPPIA